MKALLFLTIALAFGIVLSLALGDLPIAPVHLYEILLEPHSAPDHLKTILWDLRLPRAVLAVLVGAALAVAGTVTQSIMRNPLAEPGILGINSGAALAAVVLIVGQTNVSVALLPWFSFAGALTMSCAIYLLAWHSAQVRCGSS